MNKKIKTSILTATVFMMAISAQAGFWKSAWCGVTSVVTSAVCYSKQSGISPTKNGDCYGVSISFGGANPDYRDCPVKVRYKRCTGQGE